MHERYNDCNMHDIYGQHLSFQGNHDSQWVGLKFLKQSSPLAMATFFEAVLFGIIVVTLIMGTLSLSLTKQFYCSDTIKQKTSSAYKLLQLVALGSIWGFFIAYLFHAIVFLIEVSSTKSLFANEKFALFDFLLFSLLYTMSWSSFYTFMVLRIKYTYSINVR